MSVTILAEVTLIVNDVQLPTLDYPPTEDPNTYAWRAMDSDWVTYWGQSALDCERQFAAELVRLATALSDGDVQAVTERWHESETTDAEEMWGCL